MNAGGLEVVPYAPSLAAAWDAFVAGCPGATPGHDRRWPDLFSASFGHRPASLVAMEGGHVRGVLPLVEIRNWIVGRLLVSLPWLDAAGVCVDGPDARSALLSAAERLARAGGARSLEVRALERYPEIAAVREEKAVLHLALPRDEGAAWGAFDPKLRNQVRKSERAGLAVEIGRGELLRDFYDPFSRNMRELGVPVWGADFYARLLDAFPAEAELLVVRSGGRSIGGGLLIHWGSTALVPCASSVREAFDACPNHALYWAAIRRAIARGARVFDFGRSTVDSGTYRFKRSWGSEPVACRWHRPLETDARRPSWNTANPRLRVFVAAWRRLPLSVTRLLGPRIVRNLP